MDKRNNIRLYPYKAGSESCQKLAEGLGVLRINLNNSQFKYTAKRTIVNWGNSTVPPESDAAKWINHPSRVAIAANKKTFFEQIHTKAGVAEHLIPWTCDKDTALSWLKDGVAVFARTKLTSHSGDGIVEMVRDKPETIVNAPLYTQYIPKKDEYRIHVCKGEVFFTQRKARKTEADNPNWKIRNLQNGFIYANQNVQAPEAVTKTVQDFITGVGDTFLDFYCLDIIYNEKRNKAYILEANSAPGLSGTTLAEYIRVLKSTLGLT